MNISIINEDETLINIVKNIEINCDKAIDECKIMIIGYEEISKDLINFFKNLNCYLIVSIQNKLYKQELDKLNIRNCLIYDYLSMEIYLKNVDIIINTIDDFGLNNFYLNLINKNTLIVNVKNMNNSKKYVIKKND